MRQATKMHLVDGGHAGLPPADEVQRADVGVEEVLGADQRLHPPMRVRAARVLLRSRPGGCHSNLAFATLCRIPQEDVQYGAPCSLPEHDVNNVGSCHHYTEGRDCLSSRTHQVAVVVACARQECDAVWADVPDGIALASRLRSTDRKAVTAGNGSTIIPPVSPRIVSSWAQARSRAHQRLGYRA